MLVTIALCFQLRVMRGYQKLEGPGVRSIHRLLAKIADGPLHLQIVRVRFKEESG